MEKNNNSASKATNNIAPTPGEITILSSSPNLDTSIAITEELMKNLHDCGFNATFALLSTSNIPKSMERAKNYNVKILWANSLIYPPSEEWIKDKTENIVTDSEKIKSLKDAYTDRFAYWVKEMNTYDAMGGYNLSDEPNITDMTNKYDPAKETIADFITPEGSFYSLNHRYNMIRDRIAPGQVISINLVGAPGTDYTGGSTQESFKQYLDAYAKISGDETAPYLWSYDVYPIQEVNALLLKQSSPLSTNGDLNILYERFYTDLAIFQQRAKESNGIFWAYALSVNFYDGAYYPMPTDAYFRFEIFSALAMGAQGIVYWTYQERKNKEKFTAFDALVNRNKEKSPAWYYAKRVNEEVRAFNRVFFNSNLMAYGHVGEIYKGCPGLGTVLSNLVSITATGKGVLVTYLYNETVQNGQTIKHNYIVIVSHDVENYQSLGIKFKVSSPVSELTKRKSSDPLTSDGRGVEASDILRTLIPGGYLIYEFRTT